MEQTVSLHRLHATKNKRWLFLDLIFWSIFAIRSLSLPAKEHLENTQVVLRVNYKPVYNPSCMGSFTSGLHLVVDSVLLNCKQTGCLWYTFPDWHFKLFTFLTLPVTLPSVFHIKLKILSVLFVPICACMCVCVCLHSLTHSPIERVNE